ncbi:MAG: adenylate kinase [Thermoplasmata archaeon]|nr:MAG: adenylate kinase [Thermoplasmata archaeon]
MMNRIVILTGIPGSGKTTVLDSAIPALLKEGVKYKSVNYGTVMLEIAKQMGLVKTRDEMRKLDPAKQKDIQKSAGKKISSMATTSSVIVDTHCTINTPRGYLPGLPEWVLKEIMPDTIVLVEAGAENISVRRNKDTTRSRDAESVNEIQYHQDINRAASIACCIMTGATTKIIKNEQNKLEYATKEMIKVLRNEN